MRTSSTGVGPGLAARSVAAESLEGAVRQAVGDEDEVDARGRCGGEGIERPARLGGIRGCDEHHRREPGRRLLEPARHGVAAAIPNLAPDLDVGLHRRLEAKRRARDRRRASRRPRSRLEAGRPSPSPASARAAAALPRRLLDLRRNPASVRHRWNGSRGNRAGRQTVSRPTDPVHLPGPGLSNPEVRDAPEAGDGPHRSGPGNHPRGRPDPRLRRPHRPERRRQPAANHDVRRLPRRRRALRDGVPVPGRRRGLRLDHAAAGRPLGDREGRRLDPPAPDPRDDARVARRCRLRAPPPAHRAPKRS